MTRRRLTILLHWPVLMLVPVMVMEMFKAATSTGFLRGAFVLAGGFWVVVARNGAALPGIVPQDTGWTALLVLLAAGTCQGLFYCLRQNVLFDDALRIMAPRRMSKIL